MTLLNIKALYTFADTADNPPNIVICTSLKHFLNSLLPITPPAVIKLNM